MAEVGVDVVERAQAAISNAQEGVFRGVNSGFEKLAFPNVLKVFKSATGVGGGTEEGQVAKMAPVLFTVEDPVFKSFAAAAGVLGLKLVLNSCWTVVNRSKRKVFSMPEDCPAFGGTNPNNNDPVVERVRRMHLNDIENYTAFFMLGLVYTATAPSLTEANLLFGSFIGFRLAHTACYLGLEHQPGRFFMAAGGWATNAAIALRVLQATFF